MLKSIVMVTMLVTNLNAVEEAYDSYLGYQVVEEGQIDRSLGSVWGARGMNKHPYVIMQPKSGEEVYLRFIEDKSMTNYRPMGTHGWNSTEILVEDPDALAVQLSNSSFNIIGQPYDLYPTPDAPRAMQVLGPSNEIIYLTRIIPGGSGFNLGSAQSYVDRVFIMVVGGPSMKALQDFYSQKLNMPVTEASDWTIGVISRLNNLPEDTVYPLALVSFEQDFLINTHRLLCRENGQSTIFHHQHRLFLSLLILWTILTSSGVDPLNQSKIFPTMVEKLVSPSALLVNGLNL